MPFGGGFPSSRQAVCAGAVPSRRHAGDVFASKRRWATRSTSTTWSADEAIGERRTGHTLLPQPDAL